MIDVRISYSRLDNLLVDEHGKGWVDTFHDDLGRAIREVLGYQVGSYRECRLDGDSWFPVSDELKETLKRTCVFICILSPAYIQSDWHLHELQEFCRLADENGGLVVGNKMRALKVVKTYVEIDKHPQVIQDQLGYEFFEKDPATQQLVAFRQELGPNRDERYWNVLTELAEDIGQIILAVRPRLVDLPTASVPSQTEKTIYLSETTADLSKTRNEIERDRAHDVFISYSNIDVELAREVRTALEDAGIECWMADDDILPSEIYGKAIIKAISSSRLVLLIFTANANSSKHVESEIDRAYNKHKPIILFRTEDIDLSESLEYYLSTGSWLQASARPLNAHLPTLVEKVKRLFSHQPTVE